MEKLQSKREGALLAFFGGAASLSLAAITVKVLGLIYKLPLSRVLGDEGMGYFNTAYTVYSFFYLLATAGVPKAVSILSAESRARGDLCEERRILRVALRTFFGIGLLLSALLFFLSGEIARGIGNHHAALTMAAIAPSVLFVAVGGVLRGALAGKSRLFPIALSEVVSGAAKLVFGLLFALTALRRGASLPTVSAASVLGITLGSFFALLLLLAFYLAEYGDKTEKQEDKTEQTKDKSKSVLRRILRVALPVTASGAVLSLSSLVDLALINRRLLSIGCTEAEATALYGNYTTLVLPMFQLIASVIAPISVAALPLLTARHTVGDVRGFRGLCGTVYSAAAFFSVPSALALMLLGEPILSLLFPSASARIGAPLLFVLAPAAVLMSLLTMVNTSLEAAGCLKAPLLSMGLGASVKIAAGYFLIGSERFGILGAPLGTGLSYVVGLFVSLLLYRRRGGEVRAVFAALPRPLFAASVSLLPSLCLYRLLLSSYAKSLATVCALLLCVGLYLFLSLLMGEKGINYKNDMSKYTKNAE